MPSLDTAIRGADISALSGLATQPLIFGLIISVFAALPFALLAVTSYVKLSVVFAILRNALGAGQIPSTALVSTLAIVMTFYIMSPVCRQMVEIAFQNVSDQGPMLHAGAKRNESRMPDINRLFGMLEKALAPLKVFLKQHCHAKELAFFDRLNDRPTTELTGERLHKDVHEQEQSEFRSLIPAFLLSELKEGFSIGFIVFLPFLVVDLIVSNVLVGLGMTMVSPVSIALPVKLILFVLCDGWFLLCKSLILGYAQ